MGVEVTKGSVLHLGKDRVLRAAESAGGLAGREWRVDTKDSEE